MRLALALCLLPLAAGCGWLTYDGNDMGPSTNTPAGSDPTQVTGLVTKVSSISPAQWYVLLEWRPVTGAMDYGIEVSSPDPGNFSPLGYSTATNYMYGPTSAMNTSFYFRVRARNAASVGLTYSASSYNYTGQPAVDSPQYGTSPSRVKLTWNEVPGSDYYEVYRPGAAADWGHGIDISVRMIEDLAVSSGSTYTYDVAAYKNQDGKSYMLGIRTSVTANVP